MHGTTAVGREGQEQVFSLVYKELLELIDICDGVSFHTFKYITDMFNVQLVYLVTRFLKK